MYAEISQAWASLLDDVVLQGITVKLDATYDKMEILKGHLKNMSLIERMEKDVGNKVLHDEINQLRVDQKKRSKQIE